MDQGMMFNMAALVTSLAALTTSTLLAVRHLRTAQDTNPTLVIVELLTRERRSSEFLESDDYVQNRLSVEHPPDHGIYGLPTEARTHALRIGLYYTSLGMLSTFRGMNTTVLIGAVSWSVKVSWAVLEPYILAERRLRNNLYMSYFEHLVCVASDVAKATLLQHLRRLPHPMATLPTAPHPTGPAPVTDRAVITRLKNEVVEARESATRADTKAATLLGVVGAGSVLIVTVLAAASRGDTSPWTAVALIMGWVGAAKLTAAAVLLVLAVRPHLRILRPAGRQVSWLRFVGMGSPDEVISTVRAEASHPHPEESVLAARLLPLAELAHRKHRLIRTAADLVLAATAVVAAAAALYALVP